MTRITDNTRKALQHREISVPQRFFRLVANNVLQSRRKVDYSSSFMTNS